MQESNERDRQLAQCAADVVHKTIARPIVRVEKIPRGLMTHKFAVTCAGDQSFVVRFYPPARAFVVDYEPDIVRRCADAGAPTPQVLADSRSGPPAKLPYMLYRMIPGTTLDQRLHRMTQERLSGFCRQFASCLLKLREIRFSGFGEPYDAWRARSKSWRRFVEQSYREGLAAIRHNRLLDGRLMDDLNRFSQTIDSLPPQPDSRFIWGDVNPQNILLDEDDRLAGIIDFEGVLAGDHLLTLGYTLAGCGWQPLFTQLTQCWQERLDQQSWKRIYFYAVLRTVRLGKYAHQPLPTGHARAALREIFPGFQTALRALNDDFGDAPSGDVHDGS